MALLAPVAGLGMGVLLARAAPPGAARHRPAARPARAGAAGTPALAIAAHGLFAVTALLLTLMAAIGAG